MINWRDGKGGLVGGLKHFIKGVFRFSHSVTSATAVTPEVSATRKYAIDFPPEDRRIEFAFEDRGIEFSPENRNIEI